jgi:hypothetical protein
MMLKRESLMTSRSAFVAMFMTFAAIGLAFAISINRIDDLPVQLVLSLLYVVAILGIMRMLRRRA